jgi:ribosomal protein S18 acetylase RimI-like enzyme
MKIRTFNMEQDYPSVRELWEGSGPGVQLSPSDEPDEILKKLERDPDLFLVLEEQGELVGSVIGGYDGRRGIIYHLAVRPDRRGAGYGKALMHEIEARLQGKGCYKYYLLVRRELDQVFEFYQSLGCEVMDLYVLGKVLR